MKSDNGINKWWSRDEHVRVRTFKIMSLKGYCYFYTGANA